MRTPFLLLLALWLVTPLQAATVAGIDFPPRVQSDEGSLLLNGAGLRRKFFIKVYAAGLYLPQRVHEARQILAANSPWRVEMQIIHSRISAEKINSAWREGFEKNQDAAMLERLAPRLERFQQLFPDLHEGQRLVFEHWPGQGVRIALDGRELGRIEGDDFARALLAVWLGPEPADDDLKAGMLGTD
ncbi:MAG: hypothetical protein D6717_01565 [Gammaproteobacteria bacterium]|nr:MAG: hypothetical protein D6717_01565 [Gammaproteobacteria bacterium]